ncbi:MAG: ATP-binding response regulator [Planctomycetota bacterium]|jgi:PAS domain S-box-containing protein
MKRILIADDNADARYSLKLQLSAYDVLEAGGGAETVALAIEENPDCILLDVQMPDMDGFEVCRRLRSDERTRSIPIILVTGIYRDTESLVRGLAAGGDEYITKPVERRELLARVHAMLRIRDLQDRLEVLNEELEGQVRRRTEELRNIYATVPVGLYTLDASGRITSFNRHMERMLGYPRDEVVGKMGINALFGPDYDALYWLDLCRREGRTAAETHACHQDGRLLPVFDERVVTLDHIGEHVGFTGYMQDITHQRRVRAILKDQETQAGVGRLAAGIVHEIANPISGVVHYLDATVKRLDKGDAIEPDELRRGAEVMRDALGRTTDLITNLRGLTRPVVAPTAEVDLGALLKDIQSLMRHGLHGQGIEMTVSGDSLIVRGDAGRLAQVFLNLVTNARDAMPDGGSLAVEVRAEDSSARIEFRDTGCGMDAATRDRIFEYLFTTKGEQGTGYGLTLSRDIVAEHGGRIEVESEVGKGSTFVISLPR